MELVVLLREWPFGEPFIISFARVPNDIIYGQDPITTLRTVVIAAAAVAAGVLIGQWNSG